MNRLTIAAALASALIACSGDADIGVDQQPISCLVDQSTGEFEGRLTSPYNQQGELGPGGTQYELGAVQSVRLNTHPDTGNPTAITLGDGTTTLQFFFSCGAPTRDTYDVYPSDQSTEVPCPLSVTSSAGGQLEYLPTQDGKFIIDENESCLAGRFSVDFGANGKASGWFTTPK